MDDGRLEPSVTHDHDLSMPPQKHAILILAHEAPLQLERLIRRLRHARISIYVHVDQASTLDHQNVIEAGATVISTRSLNWGGMSICEASIDLLQRARGDGPFRTYSLISGRDYPVESTEILVSELDEIQVSIVDCWHDEDPTWHNRYRRWYFNDSRWKRPMNALARRLSPFFPERRVPDGIKVHFGWLWFTILDPDADLFLQFCQKRSDVLKWYKRVHIPDESLLQTALMNSKNPPELDRETRRYIIFENGSARPRTMDLPMVKTAVDGPYWFARKFYEESSPGLLDEVDQLTSKEDS